MCIRKSLFKRKNQGGKKYENKSKIKKAEYH